MSEEKRLDYETMTPEILAQFIFEVSGYKVDKVNILCRIEHMINKELSKRSINNVAGVIPQVVEKITGIKRALEIRKELFDIANSYAGNKTGMAAVFLHGSCNRILDAYEYLQAKGVVEDKTTPTAIETAGEVIEPTQNDGELYKRGEELIFNIYGYITKGEFVKKEDELFTIKTTQDIIRELIGTEQTIHEGHLVKERKEI